MQFAQYKLHLLLRFLGIAAKNYNKTNRLCEIVQEITIRTKCKCSATKTGTAERTLIRKQILTSSVRSEQNAEF